MPKTTEYEELYFQHDLNARFDEKIIKMFFELRKNRNDFTEECAKKLLPFAAYGVYWAVVEYMHKNTLEVADIDMLADELRVDTAFLKSILTEFNLFRQENGVFVNDRIIRNIEKQEEKANKGKKSANIRWLLSAYTKAYNEEFGITPVLDDAEKKKLIEYSNKIEDFRNLLPDILYTLHGIKFDNDINYKPTSNWLLKGNNLAQILNGQWGKLKHKKTPSELRAEQQQAKAAEEEPSKVVELANSICNKVDALELIAKHSKFDNGRLMVLPTLAELKKRFDITDREIKDYLKESCDD